MKSVIYLVDEDFNYSTKIKFEKESMLEEYIIKHQEEEKKSHMMILSFDSNDEIISVKIFKNGKCICTKVCLPE